MNKPLFLINPISGSGNGYKFFKKYLENHKFRSEFDIVFTEHRGHATQICSQLSQKYNRVIVCGGDGTLNEALNGLKPEINIDIGVIPVGSGNDFSRSISLNYSFHDFINAVILNKYYIFENDIGYIKYQNHGDKIQYSRRFINSCGIGFDAYVAYLNQNTKKIKGKLSYIYSILIGLLNSVCVEINGFADEKSISGKYLLIAVGNGKTAGGGLYLTPNAETNDNILDYTMLKEVSKLKLIFSLLPKAILNKIKSSTEIFVGKYKYASFELKNPYFVHVDGESLSPTVKKIEISIYSHKLRLIKI